ncbi:MAG: hypothetical protein VR75_04610 [Hyphomonadaceae bacterium BRH_c29]|nr:MAG: hypothetical protein VR75_04610 [Hyphomonadaceae bacterium BRH_c29]
MALRNSVTPALLLLSTFVLTAYGEVSEKGQSESQIGSNWDTQCLADLSDALEAEIESLKLDPSSRVHINRNISVSLQDGQATVMIFSLQRVPLVVGDRMYHFSCDDKVLTHEPYPPE